MNVCECFFLRNLPGVYRLPAYIRGQGSAHHKPKPYLQVALIGVQDVGLVCIVLAHELGGRVIDGWLEVAVLSIDHQPHLVLHAHGTVRMLFSESHWDALGLE